ncbi:rhamnulokinase [Paenibacillus sp. HJL G12]|uniref:Rhamnulokinase n=1 Tax=Paenibacillus dendrobii TaxID=2691084 RepID=A0A7X3IKK1_9BACL|nr:rhamnulokinase family protein [Paenibacillus dendrobii]MWV43742.1 rhamnulokinase [Paenibacillus dendrobii]
MSIIAFDLGASSGRALAGDLKGNRIQIKEIHRFSNGPIQRGGHLYWDIDHLFAQIKQGLAKAKSMGKEPDSLGIDSWAVDYGLIAQGRLLQAPYHYRDHRTDGVMDRVGEKIGRSEIFSRTGIQFLPFNTIYQLAAMGEQEPEVLIKAERFLMIPELLRYWLTGEMISEFTNATTTQLVHEATRTWDVELISRLGLKRSLFGSLVQPGTPAGRLLSSVSAELGLGTIPVMAVGEHDTASAVASVPAMESSFAYLSCGTWSLLGTEVDQPVTGRKALDLNFTNEGGVGGKYRLLKNIMGLWILQELKREWDRKGQIYSFEEWVALSRQAPAFASWINPDDPAFLPAGDMSVRIREFCLKTKQQAPEQPGEFARCILESLALQYRHVLEQTELLSERSFPGLYMVGGGIRNELLCQWTANAIGRPVWAGPIEGSAIGNLAVQWIGTGEIRDLEEARTIIRNSFAVREYEPAQGPQWQEAYDRFCGLGGM